LIKTPAALRHSGRHIATLDSQSPTAQIVAAGHDPTVVDRVLQLVARAEFKRRQAPPGLKITDRAFGTGWRMPIANKWVSVSTYQAETIPCSQSVAHARNFNC